MNIFTIFFYKILAKYSPKRTKLLHFKKKFSREHAPEPPLANAWLCHALCKNPNFSKNILKPSPPPPPIEILDTPLDGVDTHDTDSVDSHDTGSVDSHKHNIIRTKSQFHKLILVANATSKPVPIIDFV